MIFGGSVVCAWTTDTLENWDWVVCLVWSVHDSLNVFITVYYLFKVSKLLRKSRSELLTIDLNMVLKDEDLFKKYEELLMKVFRIEYLNFLVS